MKGYVRFVPRLFVLHNNIAPWKGIKGAPWEQKINKVTADFQGCFPENDFFYALPSGISPPKLTVKQNFGFLYDSINLKNNSYSIPSGVSRVQAMWRVIPKLYIKLKLIELAIKL